MMAEMTITASEPFTASIGAIRVSSGEYTKRKGECLIESDSVMKKSRLYKNATLG
jgi:hypothetical protein